MYLRSLAPKLCVLSVLMFASALAQNTSKQSEQAKPVAEYAPLLRWGKPAPNSDATKITAAVESVFKKNASNLNFSKRGLTTLLEEGLPRQIGRLFPFRKPHHVPQELFFENFAPVGFLVGELNPRVPPILAETATAEWLELKSQQPLTLARELNKPTSTRMGLRGLALQNPWATEIFSSTWNSSFDSASALLEHGGLSCLKKATLKNLPETPNLPAHFRCSAPLQSITQDIAISKQLTRRLNNVVAPQTNTAAATPGSSSCVPMGRLNMQSLELLGDEKAGHCLLWRASRDERFQQRPLASKLVCLNSRHKSFQRTRFSSVVAVLPSSRADSVHLIESDDGRLTSHRLSLATLTVNKNDLSSNSNQNLQSTMFPRQRTGLYLCQAPAAPSSQPFAPEEVSTTNAEWVYIEDSIYAGLRAVQPEMDVGWRIKETSETSLLVERLNWPQLQYEYPSITSERTFVCAVARDLDSKCAIRIVQTALQMSEEWLADEYQRNSVPFQVQLSAALLLAQSLEKTLLTLPDWALREETEALFGFYREKVRSLAENPAFAGTPPRIEFGTQAIPTARRYLDLPSNAQEFLALKNSISSAGGFWATLKQKPL